MLKHFFLIIKKVIFSFSIIYGLNVLLKNTGICIPINYITVLLTTILGVPGLISVIAILLIL